MIGLLAKCTRHSDPDFCSSPAARLLWILVSPSKWHRNSDQLDYGLLVLEISVSLVCVGVGWVGRWLKLVPQVVC